MTSTQNGASNSIKVSDRFPATEAAWRELTRLLADARRKGITDAALADRLGLTCSRKALGKRRSDLDKKAKEEGWTLEPAADAVPVQVGAVGLEADAAPPMADSGALEADPAALEEPAQPAVPFLSKEKIEELKAYLKKCLDQPELDDPDGLPWGDDDDEQVQVGAEPEPAEQPEPEQPAAEQQPAEPEPEQQLPPPTVTEPDPGFEDLDRPAQRSKFFDHIGIFQGDTFIIGVKFEGKGKGEKWEERWFYRRGTRKGQNGCIDLHDTLHYGSHTPTDDYKGTVDSSISRSGSEDMRNFHYFIRTADFKKAEDGVTRSMVDVERRRTYSTECDADAGDLQAQRERVRLLAEEGLHFNAVVFSGSKSLHLHLRRPHTWETDLEQDRWVDQAICLLVEGDTNAQRLSQNFRLPGCPRPGGHEQRLIGGRKEPYSSFEELEAVLVRLLADRGIAPGDVADRYSEREALQRGRSVKTAIERVRSTELGQQWEAWKRAGGWSDQDKARAEAVPIRLSAEQLLDFLPRGVKNLVQEGSESGCRNDDGLLLTLNLRGAVEVLDDLGLDVWPVAQEVLDRFADNSDRRPGEEIDRDRLLEQFAGAEGALPGRPVDGFMNSLGFHTRGQVGTPKPKALPGEGSSARDKLLAAIGPHEWRYAQNGDPIPPPKISVGRFADMIDDLGKKLRWNDVTMAIEYEGEALNPKEVEGLYVPLNKQDRLVSQKAVIDTLVYAAYINRYDPVKDYLEHLRAADEIEPVDINTIASTYLETKDPLYDKMMKVALLGAVNRRLNPGCQFDTVAILQGAQGCKKSSFWKVLASPDWYTSSIPEGDKDLILNVHAAWIYELAELENITGKHDVGKLKNLISTSSDMARAPYGKATERMHRTSIFVSTVNGEDFLRDNTGERRYHVIPVHHDPARGEFIDIDAVREDRDSIWKAALLALEAGDKPYLMDDDQNTSNTKNEAYHAEDAWESALQTWLHPSKRELEALKYSTREGFDYPNPLKPFTTADALLGSGVRDLKNIDKRDTMRMAELLKKAGYFCKQDPPDPVTGARHRRWRPLNERG